jgi:hypothetical protein
MSDRELIRLASKAAGVNGPQVQGFDGIVIGHERDGHIFWNPLKDDGDALRLAVKLRMALSLDSPVAGPVGFCRAYPSSSNLLAMDEWANDDRYTATRRAIVRAAADIGKQMEKNNGN